MSLAVQDDRLTTRVGAIVLVLLAAAIVFVITVLDRIELRSAVKVRVYFGQDTALREGTVVVVAGRTVGEIVGIELVPQNLAGEGHPLHGTGGIAAVARIESRYAHMVSKNGEFFISSRSMFAPRYLEVGPPPGGAASERAVQDGDGVRGIDPPSLDRVMQRTWDNLTDTRLFLDALAPEMDALVAALRTMSTTLDEVQPEPGAMDELITSVQGVRGEAARLGETLDSLTVDADSLTRLADAADATSAQLGHASADLRARLATLGTAATALGDRIPDDLRARLVRTAAAAELSLARLEILNSRVRDLFARIGRGEGTIGGLMNDPEFADEAKELGKIIKREPWRLFGRPEDVPRPH